MNGDFFSQFTNAREYLDEIIEHSFDGIYITDGEGNTIKINRSYEHLTGLKRENLLGHNMAELEEKKIISASGSLIAIREKRTITLQQKFSTNKQCLITSTPIYNKTGKIIMVVTNVRDVTELLRVREAAEKVEHEKERMERELSHLYEKTYEKDRLIAVDQNSLETFFLADRVAPLDTTVMLLGESGVGKEVFAQYIYNNSKRSNKRYIKVNCGAIPDNLIESELFGYEKGAFTGADRNGKMGLFEVADGGTIFLDEMGELPLAMQTKLLRVIQEREIVRIGGVNPIKLDVRVIAATNRNLEEMVSQKLFREDLYYRLMVFPIHIPPLRERKGDIIPLANCFLKDLNNKYCLNKRLSVLAMRVMSEYQWPGNVRELRNIMERAIIISRDEEIEPKDLAIMPLNSLITSDTMFVPEELDMKSAMAALEYKYIKQAYEKYGNVRDAAKSLNMSASSFVRRKQKYSEEHKNMNI